MKKKVLVGISGGVDSAVSAYLLKREGYEVIGATIQLNDIGEKELEEIKDICKKMKIEHKIITFKKEFQKNVIDYFLSEYSRGNTPSPCIICDEKIKFGSFLKYAEKLECDYIATGHYVKKIYSEKYKSYGLKKGKDVKKDQSYMLYRLSKNQIQKSLFPLSDYTKEEIKKIAEENNLINSKKKESQGICFAKKGYIEYLKRKLGNEIKKGKFVDKKGNIIGEHNGYQLYTIGQRRGLGLNLGRPYFIIDIIPSKNEIMLGEFSELLSKKVEIRDWKLPFLKIKKINNMSVIAKPRFSSKGHKAKLNYIEGKLEIEYDFANAENTRGQHIVFYDKDGIVLGGGIIAK
ncbi:MAG: tRNA 2-thiouridine(34) synthase MnmA [Fusobacteriia bacterium 4572_132]|nr:MAG: tRNA 2-thiouridine(34) synthase MnmA [Fusobacteriia bacterium 4572_132]